MEWVETTGKTVDEARELALDQLGVDASEAEFELLEEPKSGLFGRTRGAARVRARVAPVVPQPKTERRRKTRKSDDSGRQRGGSNKGDTKPAAEKDAPAPSKDAAADSPSSDQKSRGARAERRDDSKNGRGAKSQQTEREPMDADEQISTLEAFIEGLLQSFGIEGNVAATLEDNELRANVTGEGLGLLVGSRLATLDAVQDVARHALQRQAAGREYAKVIVDVDGVRLRRREALTAFVTDAAQQVRDGDVEVVFDVMTSIDRKQVHDLVGELDGVASSSEGEDPRRRVVLRKA